MSPSAAGPEEIHKSVNVLTANSTLKSERWGSNKGQPALLFPNIKVSQRDRLTAAQLRYMHIGTGFSCIPGAYSG